MVRVANTGISAVIDAEGRIVASLELSRAGYFDQAVPRARDATFYAGTGDWPLAVALLLGLLWLGVSVTRARVA